MAWYYLLSNVHGALNYILMQTKLVPDGVNWLGSSGPLPMASLITVNVWHEAGLFAVLLLAGLRSIGSEMIDSARLDGATSTQLFLHVVLPCCGLPWCWERRSPSWDRSATSPSSMS